MSNDLEGSSHLGYSRENDVEKQIRDWSEYSLEKKNGKSLPMCPYAENTWNSNKVSVRFSYKDYEKEIIVIDDYSTDGTLEVIKEKLSNKIR